MTLFLMDGFDHQCVATLSYGNGGNDPTLVSGRAGVGKALQTYEDGGGYIALPTLPSGVSEVWVGVAYKGRWCTADRNNWVLRGLAANGNTQILVEPASTNGSLKVWCNGSGDQYTAGAIYPNNDWCYVELHIAVASSGGTIDLRVNGTTVHSYTGNTRNGADDVRVWQLGSGRNSAAMYDDLVVMVPGTGLAGFLGDVRVLTILPDGNGNSSDGVGSDANSTDNYALVNEAVPSASEYVDLGVGDKDTYAYASLATPGTSTIHAVQTVTQVSKTDAGSVSVAGVARLSGTESTSTPVGVASGTVVHRAIFETKPGGGSWAKSDVDSAEFGVEAS